MHLGLMVRDRHLQQDEDHFTTCKTLIELILATLGMYRVDFPLRLAE